MVNTPLFAINVRGEFTGFIGAEGCNRITNPAFIGVNFC